MPIIDTPLIKRAYNLGLKAVPNFVEALTEEQIAYYEQHLDQMQDALRRGFIIPKPRPKFELFVNLGILTVPEGYDHATRLASFKEKNSKKFYYYNDDITNEHFSNPSRILKPGDKLQVLAFKQVVEGHTTSEERMAFLKSQNAVFTGAQGVSLLWEEKRNELPKGLYYVSMDEKKHLWLDSDRGHRVPYVLADSDGFFKFLLGSFENDWDADGVLLCFRDCVAEPSDTR